MLSIIIPTRNEENFLPALLDSIKAQDFSDYEIIVSDGGSCDRTAALATAAGCRLVTDGEHRHPGWQRNNGAAVARGDLFLFLDADVILQPNFLTPSVAEFKRRGLDCAGFYIKFNPNRLFYRIYATICNLVFFIFQYFSPLANGSGIMVTKDRHERIHGFDTTIFFGEDSEYCWRATHQARGKFRIIRACWQLYSSRRLEREGAWRGMWKWVRINLHTFFKGHIRHEIKDYKLGGFEK